MRPSLPARSLAALLVLGAGCTNAHSRDDLVIEGVLGQPPDGECVYDPIARAFLGEGILDTSSLGEGVGGAGALEPRYVALLRLANNLRPPADRHPAIRYCYEQITVLAADVELTNADGSPVDFGGLPSHFRTHAHATVQCAGPDGPGLGVTDVELVPVAYAAALAGLDDVHLIASVRLLGRTLVDVPVESAEFLFPIDVCSGCLYECVTDVADATTVCSPGQDLVTRLAPGTAGCPPAGP